MELQKLWRKHLWTEPYPPENHQSILIDDLLIYLKEGLPLLKWPLQYSPFKTFKTYLVYSIVFDVV